MPHSVTVGGAQEALREAMRRLARRGHRVTVFCATAPALGDLRPPSQHDGVDVYEHDGLDKLLAAARLHIQTKRPDVVLVPTEDPAQRPLDAVIALDAPAVALAQTPATLPFGPGCARPDSAAHALLRRGARLLASSIFLGDYIRQYGQLDARTVTLPPAASSKRPHGRSDRERVLMVNPSVTKGRTILTGLADLRPDVCFRAVAGWATGPEDRAALLARPNIELVESCPDIAPHLDASQLLLVPSIWLENVPLVIGEAQRAGVPVLAANVGGIPEALDGLGTLLPVTQLKWRQDPNGGPPMPFAPPQPIKHWARAMQTRLALTEEERARASCQLSAEARRRAAELDVAALESELEAACRRG